MLASFVDSLGSIAVHISKIRNDRGHTIKTSMDEEFKTAKSWTGLGWQQ